MKNITELRTAHKTVLLILSDLGLTKLLKSQVGKTLPVYQRILTKAKEQKKFESPLFWLFYKLFTHYLERIFKHLCFLCTKVRIQVNTSNTSESWFFCYMKLELTSDSSWRYKCMNYNSPILIHMLNNTALINIARNTNELGERECFLQPV